MRIEAPLFGLGLQGKSPDVTANKLINAYYEFQTEEDGTKVAIYGTPGLTLKLDKGDTPWRGLHSFPGNSMLYGVHRGTFYSIDNAWSVTARGTIGTTSGRVDICDDGTRISVVDGSEIYVYDTSTPATPIAAVADADRPTSPNTCIVQAGRVLTDEDSTGQFKGSDAYAPTSWDPLNFATAESNPDNLIRIVNYRGIVVLFGAYTTEFWQNVGGAGYPYARIMGADMEHGLAARWSVSKFNGTYAFLAQNREGQVIVGMLNGYQPTRISNFELEHIINGYSNVADATGYGYMLGGHPMYQLNFPSEGKSWLYDASTQYWSELTYAGTGRHRAEFGVDFLNQTIVADYSNGKLYKLDTNALDDNGQNIVMVLRGRHIRKDKKNVRISRLELGIEPGVGLVTGQGSDPVAGLRLSKDGGHSYGTQTFSKMGKMGDYTARCAWRRLGIGRDIVPEITITDPVKRVITDSVLIMDDGMS
jgi:hypothetical protein